jgi:hypothetical protein
MLLQNVPSGLSLSYRSEFQPPGRDFGFPLFESVIKDAIANCVPDRAANGLSSLTCD